MKGIKPIAACTTNFVEIRESVLAYAREHGDTLPAADKWQDEVRPFLVATLKHDAAQRQPFGELDPKGDWRCVGGNNGTSDTGIAFNSDVGGKKVGDLKDPYGTVLLFEVPEPKQNDHSSYKFQANGPKVLNAPRPWITANVKGRISMQGGSGNWNFDDSSSGDSASSSAGGDSGSGSDQSSGKDDSSGKPTTKNKGTAGAGSSG